ncbi:SIR2 family protein [Blastococcus deserti]|uniref:SIR2 family protein n=1 Tax=Blastococcus deserti TaxID=2259033 RepID=A0ABW4XEJ6_9ACTN
MPGEFPATRARFLREYADDVEQGRAALLVGAGLSRAAGFVDWRGLLRDLASDLGLDIDEEYDLPGVAQYHLDANNQDRSRLNRMLREHFQHAQPVSTRAHEALARLPVRDVWTTNYEDTLERTYEAADRVVDVKRLSAQASWTSDRPGSDATVYKMHGDTDDVGSVVLSREDYDTYEAKYPHVPRVLQAHLTQKTFLIVGFSLTDPNIDHVLAQQRAAFGANQRQHWAVFKREAAGREAVRQGLRIRSLKRYGIETVLVDDYSDVPVLLEELADRLARRNVLVSASSGDATLLPGSERQRIETIAEMAGRAIITTGHNLVSGVGLGAGAAVLAGAAEQVYRGHADPARRLVLRPFPRPAAATPAERAELWTRWREDMARNAGIAIFIAGCRDDGQGNPEVAAGVLEEFKIAVEQGWAWPLPIGATGWAARELHVRVWSDRQRYLPDHTPWEDLETLGLADATVEQLTGALERLLRSLHASASTTA